MRCILNVTYCLNRRRLWSLLFDAAKLARHFVCKNCLGENQLYDKGLTPLDKWSRPITYITPIFPINNYFYFFCNFNLHLRVFFFYILLLSFRIETFICSSKVFQGCKKYLKIGNEINSNAKPHVLFRLFNFAARQHSAEVSNYSLLRANFRYPMPSVPNRIVLILPNMYM